MANESPVFSLKVTIPPGDVEPGRGIETMMVSFWRLMEWCEENGICPENALAAFVQTYLLYVQSVDPLRAPKVSASMVVEMSGLLVRAVGAMSGEDDEQRMIDATLMSVLGHVVQHSENGSPGRMLSGIGVLQRIIGNQEDQQEG